MSSPAPLPCTFDQFSAVTCSATRARDGDLELLVLAFRGVYRPGSQGNPDARRMRAEALAHLGVWPCDGLLLDLRELAYTWGDAILGVLDLEVPDATLSPPTLILAGPASRPGLSTLVRPDVLFDDLDLALGTLADRARAARDEQERSEDALILPLLVDAARPPARAAALAAIYAREHFCDRWQLRLWVTGAYRLAVFAASPADLEWALTQSPAVLVKDPEQDFAPVGVALCPRVDLPERLLALPRLS